MSTLWLVKIHKYDCFVSGVVWAETAEEAERLIREHEDRADDGLPRGNKTRLTVSPAPASGVVHTHWHAG